MAIHRLEGEKLGRGKEAIRVLPKGNLNYTSGYLIY